MGSKVFASKKGKIRAYWVFELRVPRNDRYSCCIFSRVGIVPLPLEKK